YNWLLVLVICVALIQGWANHKAQQEARRRLLDARVASVRRLLEISTGLLNVATQGSVNRALVTLLNDDNQTRHTVLGVHTTPDPEHNSDIPKDFGVAGSAFMHNRTCCENVNGIDDNNQLGKLNSSAKVWEQVRCVLAYPLSPSDNPGAIGTLNF